MSHEPVRRPDEPKRPKVELTKEELEQIKLRAAAEERAKAECRARSADRQKQKLKNSYVYRLSEQYKGRPVSDQIQSIINKWIARLLVESQPSVMPDIDLTNSQSRRERKEMMAVVREDVHLIQNLMSLRDKLKEEEADQNITTINSSENVELLDNARARMKALGYGDDL